MHAIALAIFPVGNKHATLHAPCALSRHFKFCMVCAQLCHFFFAFFTFALHIASNSCLHTLCCILE